MTVVGSIGLGTFAEEQAMAEEFDLRPPDRFGGFFEFFSWGPSPEDQAYSLRENERRIFSTCTRLWADPRFRDYVPGGPVATVAGLSAHQQPSALTLSLGLEHDYSLDALRQDCPGILAMGMPVALPNPDDSLFQPSEIREMLPLAAVALFGLWVLTR